MTLQIGERASKGGTLVPVGKGMAARDCLCIQCGYAKNIAQPAVFDVMRNTGQCCFNPVYSPLTEAW